MGLRINFNQGILTSLRTLRINQNNQTSILERLSTAKRINRASDDPAGFIAVNLLSGQILANTQAFENVQNAVNLFNVADAGLGQISERLIDLRGDIIAVMNEGFLPDDVRQILQSQIDVSIDAINRLAGTVRYGDRNLLNGSLGFNIQDTSSQLDRITVFQADVPGNGLDVEVNVTNAATRAEAQGTIAATQSQDTTVRIQGTRGTVDINIQTGSTRAQVIEAINAQTEFTGVEAASDGTIRSREFGTAEFVRVENVQGELEGVTAGFSRGTDIEATVNGIQFTGQANKVTVNLPNLKAEIDVQQEQTGTFSFRIEGGGARIQIGTEVTDNVTIGINSVQANFLGESSGLGNLQSITTGGTNNILDNPANALNIIQSAEREVNTLRSQIGSTVSSLFNPIANNIQINVQNIAQARSFIGDTDFAKSIAELIRSNILNQAGINTLRAQNLRSGAILNLLA